MVPITSSESIKTIAQQYRSGFSYRPPQPARSFFVSSTASCNGHVRNRFTFGSEAHAVCHKVPIKIFLPMFQHHGICIRCRTMKCRILTNTSTFRTNPPSATPQTDSSNPSFPPISDEPSPSAWDLPAFALKKTS